MFMQHRATFFGSPPFRWVHILGGFSKKCSSRWLATASNRQQMSSELSRANLKTQVLLMAWPLNSTARMVRLKNRQYLIMTRVLRGHGLRTKSIQIYDRTKAALVELP